MLLIKGRVGKKGNLSVGKFNSKNLIQEKRSDLRMNIQVVFTILCDIIKSLTPVSTKKIIGNEFEWNESL